MTRVQGSKYGRSPDNVRPRWLFVQTKFGLGGHLDQSRTRFPNNYLKKIICFISGKHKQLNHKISQQLVVTKWDADFSNSSKYGEKISIFENIRTHVDRALVFLSIFNILTSQKRDMTELKLVGPVVSTSHCSKIILSLEGGK